MTVSGTYRVLAQLSERGSHTLSRAIAPDGSAALIKAATPHADIAATEQLHREYELGGDLDHPNLLKVLDFTADDARPLLVLDDDGGVLLHELVSAGALPVRSALTIAAGIAAGIAELHRQHIIHRDITPDVVMISNDMRSARIVDLGMATAVARVQPALVGTSGSRGSLPYISPEQTGRTSRPIDFRTDLYSLGITIFEMLTGLPPFTSTEPLDLVHDHLAIRAPLVSQRRHGVPRIVDDLVAKLLEKDPSDRYRSAAGVMHDLAMINDYVLRGLDPDTLQLSGVEISTRFQLPDQLFGREKDVAELERWLDRACAGHASLVLVHGYSGVGKSSLIEALRSSVNSRRGYQTIGKFDQLDRGSAYQAVAAAFRDLVRHMLMEDDDRVARWRRDLLSVLGDGAGVLTELIPELTVLLGRVPPPQRLDAESERHRFNRLVSLFLSNIASAGQPLVIVLDDLQWADVATLEFVERIARESSRDPLLIIGAFRDNEVDSAHPVHALREHLIDAGVEFGEIGLEPLSREATGELVAASLGRPIGDAAPLTDVCIRRTGGNPFFVRLFLRSLYEAGVLHLDTRRWAWSWDMEQVVASKLTDNMVEVAIQNVGKVDDSTSDLLAVMAIIGTEADAELFDEIGLDGAVGRLRQLAAQELVNLLERPTGLYWQFAHDRIQEAAYTLLDAPSRLAWHARIGAALRRRMLSGDVHSASLFTVLRHLNEVARVEGVPNLELAEMNLAGGLAAMRATAYDAALRYFTVGVGLLAPDAWVQQTDTSFALHIGAADAARLATKFDEMERWLAAIDESASEPAHRRDAALLRILYLSHIDDNLQAVAVARDALSGLGWDLPVAPALPRVIAGLVRTRMMLRKYSIERLEQLPVMSDPTARSMMALLNESVSAAYFADPNVMAVMIQKAMRLTVRHGNDPTSPLFYAAYGMVMAGIVRDPEAGVAYADLAVRLADRFGVDSKPSRVRFTRDTLVAPFKVPVREIEPSLERAYRVGLEIGDLGFGTGAFLFLGLHRLVSGVPLDRLEPDLEAVEHMLRRHAQLRNLAAALALRQFVHEVRHGATGSTPFSGPYVDGDEHLAATKASGSRMATFWTYQLRAMARYHAGDHAGAHDDLVAAGEFLDAVLGQVLVPVHHLYGVLAGARVVAGGSSDALRSAHKHRKQLAWFANHNPVMYKGPLLLADGAIAATKGDRATALRLLDAAAERAAEQAVPLVVALASSLGAELEAEGESGERSVRARDAYRLWGADALVAAHPGEAQQQTAAFTDDFADLDIATVLRASEAIGEQVDLEDLIRSLLDVMLRNAGAERVVLFRADESGVVAEAEGRLSTEQSEVTVFALDPLAEVDVADSVVRLVARTLETVLTARAVDDPMIGSDSTVQRRHIRSLLCLPLVNQGSLQGVLYFENNQVDGAFSPERHQLLRVLSTQAASALEKARLHASQQRLIEAQHKFVPVQFLQSLGHSNLFDVELGEGAVRDVDILFTDIRNFTTHLESMSPGEAVEFLNSYLAHMEPVVHAHGGFIDALGGDSILALFDSGADAGLLAAIEMARAERADNEQRRRAGRLPVRTGFGVNSGAVMMGIVGGGTSLRATIMGDAVNLASRIQELTKRYDTSMLVSENTAERLGAATKATLRPLEQVQVVGKSQPIHVFEVLDALDDHHCHRRTASLDVYRRAIAAYQSGELGEARRGFADVVAADPDDAPAAVMLERVDQLIASGEVFAGPPITRMDRK